MEHKLCRTCGTFTTETVHIFRTEGLKNKIETCLPIILSPHCLLPDTICTKCNNNVLNYYDFIKNCLESIIILEAQYDVTESCLKTRRKHDKSSATDPLPKQDDLDLAFYKSKFDSFAQHIAAAERNLQPVKIVSYDSSSEEDVASQTNIGNKRYFDDKENDLISEIVERKSLKRKSDGILCSRPKIFKADTNRRKSRTPVKVQYAEKTVATTTSDTPWNFNTLEQIYEEIQEKKTVEEIAEPLPEDTQSVEKDAVTNVPQVCLLCDKEFSGPSQFAAHVFDSHGIDMAQVISSEPVPERKKKLPNLVKITDLKTKRDSQDAKTQENGEEPPTLEPSYVCPLCPASLTIKSDLFHHLRQKHQTKAHLLCGLCLYMASSYLNLTDHLESCVQSHPISHPYICKVCKYSEDNQKNTENHVLVHDFIINFCKKEGKIFDPADYVELNITSDSPKVYSCTECGASFVSFKDFSTHRRSLHSIFHCDLCNKFYGRNSHLWKHVNRLHKGHPSITCQFCYKTSASKYHLAQHFNKIHTMKSGKIKNGDAEEEDFMNKKFEAFDFQSVRQSFMRQELAKKEEESVEVPKEIDTSSNLYTNIITNYTPPQNNGEFKCPKCAKGFHKKTLLKKHKKNCRPRLQKDLLTRCKSCSRIFKDRQSLAKHLVNYHSEYVCEICDEKVESKCEIVSHIRFTHPTCHLICCDCGNVLRNQEELRIHSQDHSNSFVCQFCADILPSKIKLKMHILSLHRKILSLSCGICLKLFETQHILRDHVRLVHRDTLTPLTSCTVCGKNYGSKWKTYDHLNKSHGRIFRACKACLEVFDTDRDLEVHYDAAHGNVPKEKAPKKEVSPVVVKKEIYESEMERDDKNYSSPEDESGCEDEPSPPPVPPPPSKISLLEKRLTAPASEPPTPKKSTPKKKAKKIKQQPIEPEYSSDQNGANTSKRTVYVNSNDPSYCDVCFKTWPAKKHLWQHYIRCHKLVAATVCGICLKTNDNYETLQKHLKEMHPTLLHGKGFGSNFICRICGRYHNASSKLRLHMAIHENFDWKLLEDISMDIKDEEVEDVQDLEDDINYESLIEQVECSSDQESSSSSDSENETETSENQEFPIKQEISNESGDDSSSTPSNSVHVKSENCTSDEDDDDEEEDEDNSMSNNSENTSDANARINYQHPDVVDSAVKSICYDDEDDDADDEPEDYTEVQTHNLNPHEIQSAVDSIL